MTVSELLDRARRRSRTNSDFVADSDLQDLIGEALIDFGIDTGGLIKHTYLTLTPRFWTHTSMAVRLTIAGGANALSATDIVITDTARSGVTGAQVATDLQYKIREAGASTATVTFSASTWKFTIDGIDATSITVAEPDSDLYADATDLLFAKTGSETATSWTGNVPQDANLEIDLPSDFLAVVSVEWDRNPLEPATFDLFASPQTHGTPTVYHIVNRTMRVSHVPISQELFHVVYRYRPVDISTVSGYQECGLSGLASTDETGLTASTQYYFKVTIDGGTQTEYDITTASDTTYAAVIALMNAQVSGSATFSLTDRDLRCTSDSSGVGSTIALAAGTIGTDLFAALTGFSAFEAAYSVLTSEVELDDEAESALVYRVASIIAEDSGDEKRAAYCLARYADRRSRYKQMKEMQNLKYRTHSRGVQPRTYRVIT